MKIGAALDSLIILIEFGLISTGVFMLLVIWRSVLKGNLRTSLIRRKPLLFPAISFIAAILIVSAVVPLPISAYQGPNQVRDDYSLTGRFRVYDPGAYDANVEIRVTRGLEANERIEVYGNFSQNGLVIRSFFINMTSDSQDLNGGVTQTISLDPGLYDVSIDNEFYADNNPQGQSYLSILLIQPISSSFIQEMTSWSSYQFILEVGMLFLFLGGICIGREDRTRLRSESVDEEPPRDDVYSRRY
ncbi:MAG: hypothetical protein ACFFCP_01100 [Promethearchaeota archaeon]